ncbi:velvet factor-domain-containing protein [Russula brevipes]|nr:velvet factor-domain-containing protein [Russula brevipes]
MDGPREYDLFVRQQPKQARMCGVGADRRPIDPPPIVQLRVIDKAGKNLPSPSPSPPPQHQQQHQPSSHPHHEPSGPLDPSMLTPAGFGAGPFLQNPYYFMFASLAKPDDDTELHWMKDGKTRCTTGSVVSSLYHLKDSENDNRDAGFFVFPDLSVRQEGSYRLKLSLFEVVGFISPQ